MAFINNFVTEVTWPVRNETFGALRAFRHVTINHGRPVVSESNGSNETFPFPRVCTYSLRKSVNQPAPVSHFSRGVFRAFLRLKLAPSRRKGILLHPHSVFSETVWICR